MEHKSVTKFPQNFLWGASSAAYQIEGAPFEDGKKASVWDNFVHIPGKTFKGTNGDVAVDHYHQWKEDVRLMAEMGMKAYRFSIAWARIFPEGRGKVNQAGLDFYGDLIDELLKNGIEPLLTIYHWDLPQALQDEYGGWESRKIIPDFVNYAETLFKAYGDRVKYWVSLNEQNIFTHQGWEIATHPPGKTDSKLFYQVNHIANLANASVINKFHEMKIKDGKIGPSFAYTPQYAVDSNPMNIIAAENAEELLGHFWMDVYIYGEYPKAAMKWLSEQGYAPELEPGDAELLKSAHPDFLGLNFYQTATNAWNPIEGGIANNSSYARNNTGKKGTAKESGIPGLQKTVVNPFVETTNWDWTIDPVGLRIALRRIESRYRIPVLITENGLGEYDKVDEKDGKVHDSYRIDFLREHVKAIQDALSDGVEVLGYTTWSYTDLLSWLNGYQKRYGLVYVDQDESMEGTLKRQPKDSYFWYKKLIATNGEDLD